jgi:hypothetical protein
MLMIYRALGNEGQFFAQVPSSISLFMVDHELSSIFALSLTRPAAKSGQLVHCLSDLRTLGCVQPFFKERRLRQKRKSTRAVHPTSLP